MIGQYLSQTNESATVAKTKNFPQLNKALVPRPAVFFSFSFLSNSKREKRMEKKTKIRESQLADFGAFRIMIAMRF